MSDSVRPADGLLVVDIGNTTIGLGVWDDDGLHDTCRVDRTDVDAWRPALEQAWENTKGARSRVVAIASVCPETLRLLADLAEEVCDHQPVVVGDDVTLPMKLDVERPEEIGVDRICSAAAAFDRVGGVCAVASCGTALTIDCISAEGVFLGGTILPGFDLSLTVLHERTNLLPRVRPSAPAGPFGKNTADAMIAGVAYGAVGAIREIVERFASKLNAWPQLFVTGGGAPLVCKLADFVDAHVPDLCLTGVALAYRKASGQS